MSVLFATNTALLNCNSVDSRWYLMNSSKLWTGWEGGEVLKFLSIVSEYGLCFLSECLYFFLKLTFWQNYFNSFEVIWQQTRSVGLMKSELIPTSTSAHFFLIKGRQKKALKHFKNVTKIWLKSGNTFQIKLTHTQATIMKRLTLFLVDLLLVSTQDQR